MLLQSIYYIILASLIFLSGIKNEKVLFYLGFFRGSLSKAFFFMFCSCLIFPMNYSGDSTFKSFFIVLGYFLFIVSVLQIFKICNKGSEDTNVQAPMMEENNRQNLV